MLICLKKSIQLKPYPPRNSKLGNNIQKSITTSFCTEKGSYIKMNDLDLYQKATKLKLYYKYAVNSKGGADNYIHQQD